MSDGSESVLTGLAQNKTAAEFVFERIKRDIIVGRLRPGQRLVERDLTERFQISRTPVREALKLLVRTQLAVNIPYRGVEVQRLSIDFARNLYDVRWGIEGLAAYLAADRASDDELAGIEQLFARIRNLTKKGERDDVMLLNHDFHRAIADAAHNELLTSRIEELWTNVNLVRAGAWKGNRRTEGSLKEHEAILVALLARDPAAARRAAEDHIRRSWLLVEAAMTEADAEAVDAQEVNS